jgi:hypothetical protein
VLGRKLPLVFNTQKVPMSQTAIDKSCRACARAVAFEAPDCFLSRNASLRSEGSFLVDLCSQTPVKVVHELNQWGSFEGQLIATASLHDASSFYAMDFEDVKGLQPPNCSRNRIRTADTRVLHQSPIADCDDTGIWIGERQKNWKNRALCRGKLPPETRTHESLERESANACAIVLRPLRTSTRRSSPSG